MFKLERNLQYLVKLQKQVNMWIFSMFRSKTLCKKIHIAIHLLQM